MVASYLPVSAAFALETTIGAPPADATAWATAVTSLATGFRLRIIPGSLDLSQLEQTLIDDERSHENILGEEQGVFPIKGSVEVPFECYLHGHGLDTNAGSQVAQTAMSVLLAHAMGGENRTNSTTLAGGGHTTTVVNVTSATNLVAGSHIALEDQDDAGRAHVRRILDVTTLAVTLDEALPFTPADGDLVHAKQTLYWDESVLVTTAGGSRTYSILFSRGEGSTPREHWLCRGCKVVLDGIEISRNMPPKLKFRVLVASFVTPEAAPDPTWTDTPYGDGPLAIGPDTKCWMVNAGTTTSTQIHVAEWNLVPGIASVPHDTLTEADTNMPGREGYGLQPGKTTLEISRLPLAQAEYTDFNSATIKQTRLSRIASEGRSWGITIPRLYNMKTPTPYAVGPSMGEKQSFHCLRNSTIDSIDNALTRSRFCIVL